MIGLGHGSTFLDKYGLRRKGSIAPLVTGKSARDRPVDNCMTRSGAGGASNGILRRRRCRKTHPLFVPQEQKESCAAIELELVRRWTSSASHCDRRQSHALMKADRLIRTAGEPHIAN